MNKNIAILCCIGTLSVGLLVGGGLGLPLGMAIGYKIPKRAQESNPSEEGFPNGKPAYVNPPTKPSITYTPRTSRVGPQANPDQTFPRDKFRFVGGASKEDVIKVIGRPDRTSTGRGAPYRDGINVITPNEDYWFYHGRSIDPASGKTDRVAKITFLMGGFSRVDFE